jgi:uncharacterized repeat protein (TIGR03806 family)
MFFRNVFGTRPIPTIAMLLSVLLSAGHVMAGPLQRVPNTTLTNMPPAPPTFGYTTTNLFPGLTFVNPICITSPPGETNRLFIVGKNGVISVITNLAAPTLSTFMDLTPQVSSQNANNGTAGERGLIGMAFHPGFATNGFFFLVYMPTNPVLGGYFDRLARFKISAGNPNQGDTNSQVVFYDQYDRDPNHNSGDIHFGADGYLYISVGDEGAEHDGRNCAQIITNSLFAGLLRIDVDKRPGNLQPNPGTSALTISTNYLIPTDNPFIGLTSYNGQVVNPSLIRTEFYATGLRNPWRWNFDFFTNSVGTNVLYCGDVGQDHYEEVDVIQKGDNLGWAYWEGTNVASGGSPALPHTTYISTSGTQIRFPIVHYAHGSLANQGNCVIGGVVYRGSNLPQLYGNYIYADYVSGNIWTLVASNYTASVTSVTGASGPATPIISDSSLNITAFGTDPRNGDVLMCATKTTGFASAATINKIIYNSVSSGSPLPTTLAGTGAFTNLNSLASPLDPLQAAPGIVSYDINLPFWSDNAIKSRWFSVPNTNLTITFNPGGNWTFPNGTVWIKHFNLQLTNGVASSEIRLETRLLVRNSSGVYGVTYRWGGSQTNATLVDAGGLDESFVVNDGGNLRTQVWHYPSQQECQACHTAAGGLGLGFRTEQLNKDYAFPGGVTNEILAYSDAGYFDAPVTNDVHSLLALAAATNNSATLEFRVRSFLAANCSQCHQPNGTAQAAQWDARITTPTALAGLINAPLVNNLGDTNNHVITPLSLSNSVLFGRVSTRGSGSIQMPPLDSNLVDSAATNLIAQWILSLTNTFWIGTAPDPQFVKPGASTNYSVTLVTTTDFVSSVSLAVTGLPLGASAGFVPNPISNGGSSTLTIGSAGATPVGSYVLTVIGSSGGQTNSDSITLIVSSNSPAAAGTLLWTSGSGTDTNWSNAFNWTNSTAGGNGPPGPQNNALFGSAATVSSPATINNFVDGNFTIGSLQYTNNAVNTSPNYHVTSISSGQSLTLTNGIIVGTATDAGANNVVNAVVTGSNGTLNINGGVIAITQGSGTDGAHQATLDLSGLGTFNVANVSRLAVAVYQVPPQLGNGGQRSAGTLVLARTNSIALTSTGVTNGILIGWNDSQGNGVANKTSTLYLGQTNSLFTDAIYTGTDKTLGALLAFNPSGLNNPTAYFRGISGNGSRVSLWGIGDTSMKNASNQSSSATNDFTGGTIDALIGNLNIGVTTTGAGSGPSTGNGTGVLTFNAGTIDASNVTNGWSTGTSSVGGTDVGAGTINVNGGTLRVNNTLALAVNTSTGTGLPIGIVNIRGGTLAASSIVAGSGSSVLAVSSSGTLAITNRAGTPAAPLSTLALTNAVVHLRINGAAVTTNIVAASVNAGGLNTIQIDAVANVNTPMTFPLISYATLNGTVPGNFTVTTPLPYTVTLANNAATKIIELHLTHAAVTPAIGTVTLSGSSLVIGGSNGSPNWTYNVLSTTNISLPLASWTSMATGLFDNAGNFLITNPVSPSNPQRFYILQVP